MNIGAAAEPVESDHPRAAAQDASLTQKSVSGGLMVVGARWGVAAAQLGSTILLARFLSPADYGLMAMAMAFITVAAILQDFGLSTATVQQPRLDPADRSALLWVSVLIGTTIAVTVVLAAPLLGALFHQPDLPGLLVALAAILPINSVAAQYGADRLRALDFRAVATADVVSTLASIMISLVLAAQGVGIICLVAGQVVASIAKLLLLLCRSRWLPSRPRRTPLVGQVVRQGMQMLSVQLMNYASQAVDTILIGRFVGVSALGLYSRAYALSLQPIGQVSGPLQNVALPVLSRLNGDPMAFRRYAARLFTVMGYTIVPALCLLAACATPLVVVMLGPDWRGAGLLLSILALASLARLLGILLGWILISQGKVSRQVRFTAVSQPVMLVGLGVGVPFGVVGVTVAFTVCAWGSIICGYLYALREGAFKVSNAMAALAAPFAISGIAASTVFAFVRFFKMPAQMQLAGAVAGGIALWLIMVIAAPKARQDLFSVVRAVRSLGR